MKYLFIFLLFLPIVSALAVSPTTLNFGYVKDFEVRELLVVNNLEEKASYEVNGKTVLLNSGEKYLFKIMINASEYNDRVLYVNEIVEGSSLINSVRIPLEYNMNGNVVKIKNSINFDGLKIKNPQTNKKDYAKIIFYFLMVIIFIIFIIVQFNTSKRNI